MTEDSRDMPESEKTFLELPRSQDCAYLDRTAIFQLRSSMTLTEQLLYPHRLSIRNLRQVLQNGGNKDAAKQVGKAVGEKAVAKGIKEVCFDRGGYLYHGRVKELADGAREAGLEF